MDSSDGDGVGCVVVIIIASATTCRVLRITSMRDCVGVTATVTVVDVTRAGDCVTRVGDCVTRVGNCVTRVGNRITTTLVEG